jgi:hypothetical protein
LPPAVSAASVAALLAGLVRVTSPVLFTSRPPVAMDWVWLMVPVPAGAPAVSRVSVPRLAGLPMARPSVPSTLPTLSARALVKSSPGRRR